MGQVRIRPTQLAHNKRPNTHRREISALPERWFRMRPEARECILARGTLSAGLFRRVDMTGNPRRER